MFLGLSVGFCVVFLYSLTTAQEYQVPECENWSQFFNADTPLGDGEDLEDFQSLKNDKPFAVCDSPTAIDAQYVDDDGNLQDYRVAAQVVRISKGAGLRCLNSDQQNGVECRDYRVRYCCPAVVGTCSDNYHWSPWLGNGDVTDTGDDATLAKFMTTHKEDLCPNPFGIEARLASNKKAYLNGNNVIQISPSFGLNCLKAEQPTKSAMDAFIEAIRQLQVNDDIVEQFEAAILALLGEGDQVPCRDYEVRFCCPITVNKLLEMVNLQPAREEEEIDEAEDFFQRVQQQFSFNDNLEGEINQC